ncbi:MAG: helix-turn-helix domain-containing protein [Acidiferrobacteraceae bacterium]
MREAAAVLRIHPITFYRGVKNGEIAIRVIRIGRRIVVPRAALDEFLSGAMPPRRGPGRPKKAAGQGGAI